METVRSGRPAVGDQLRLDGIGLCEVLRSDDPSLVTLKRPSGTTLKVGDHALRDMLALSPAARLHAQEVGER